MKTDVLCRMRGRSPAQLFARVRADVVTDMIVCTISDVRCATRREVPGQHERRLSFSEYNSIDSMASGLPFSSGGLLTVMK